MSTASRQKIGEQVAQLYLKATGREGITSIIQSCYAANARFQDPFFDVTGREKVHTQFVSMWEAFDDYTLKSYSVDECEDPKRFDINGDATYIIKGRTFNIDQQTQITLDDEGRVLFHHDVFKGTFLETIDNTPALREVFTGWRKLAGLIGDPILKSQYVDKESS